MREFAAMHFLLTQQRLVVEGAGALGVAAAILPRDVARVFKAIWQSCRIVAR